MIYTLAYMQTKHLPWNNELFNWQQNRPLIPGLKLSLLANDVLFGDAKVFVPILEMLYSLQYSAEPDYQYIIFLFEKILLDRDIIPSWKNFDWKSRISLALAEDEVNPVNPISKESINSNQFENVSEEANVVDARNYNFGELKND